MGDTSAWWDGVVVRRAEHVCVAAALLYVLKRMRDAGVQGILSSVLRGMPHALKKRMSDAIEREAGAVARDMLARDSMVAANVPAVRVVPSKGVAKDQLMTWLHALHHLDAKAEKGKMFAYAYPTSEAHEDILREAHNLFMQHNALSFVAFPALRRMEVDVVAIASNLLGGDDEVRGSMTSGGTESILLAVKTYRDRARDLYGITHPEMILPITAHAAFEKAASYFQVTTHRVGLRDNYEADVSAMRSKINSNTILLVGSAPQYPHGVMDPISEIGMLAAQYNIPFHVDACVGGFMLPWVRRLGFNVPEFDFSVKGVTSISVDVHKYGYSVKGASIILYKSNDIRQYQFHSYSKWPGGLFVSPTMQGTRSGGPIAAAWASILTMGEEGYLRYAKDIMETSLYLQQEILKIPGLSMLGKPCMTVIAFTSTTNNIFAICDVMEENFGWRMERQSQPNCAHMTLLPTHTTTKGQFIMDLRKSVETVERNPSLSDSGSAAMYGGVAKIPSPELVEQFLIALMGRIYSPEG